MKVLNKLILILLTTLSTSVSYSTEQSPFLKIIEDFSFIALSGHRINYSKASDILSIISTDGSVLASGKPFSMTSAFARRGYFEHGFTVYSTSEGKTLEYAMILRTRLELPESKGGIVDPRDLIDTRALVSTSFWITDQETEAEILNSSLFEGEAEISKAIPISYSAFSCRGLLN